MRREGKIIEILEKKTGKSEKTGTYYEIQPIVFEYVENVKRFDGTSFEITNTLFISCYVNHTDFNFKVGDKIVIDVTFKAEPWDGKWYQKCISRFFMAAND